MRVLVLPLLVILWVGAQAADDPVVRLVSGGAVRGERQGDLFVFRGIPYAAPPVGERRWRAPAPVTPWDGIRDARAFGPVCPQPANDFYALGLMEDQSEDCLYANIWCPTDATAQDRPIMVFVHGGSFSTGSGSLPFYDGSAWAERGAVVVTFNYRLGIFGFMQHPLFDAEEGDGIGGNYALRDVVHLLRWVQANGAAFGGDTQRVTLVGMSAGGVLAGMLLADAKEHAGLFHRVILQSGHPLLIERRRAQAHGIGLGVERTLDPEAEDRDPAQRRQRMRAAPTEAVLAASHPAQGLFGGGIVWQPVIGGALVKEAPTQSLRHDPETDIDLLVGSNRDDGLIFVQRLGIDGIDDFDDCLKRLFQDDADRVRDHYAPATDAAALDRISDVISDGLFAAPQRRLARWHSEAGGRAYVYRFDHVPPALRQQGAIHGIEIPYAFGRLPWLLLPTDEDRRLAEQMADAWVAFARDGDPGTNALPWPRYAAQSDSIMRWQASPVVQVHPDAERCEFWDTFTRMPHPQPLPHFSD